MVWEAGAANGGFSPVKPWLPVPREHLNLAVDRQEGDEASILEHYRRFLDFRKAHPAFAKGEIAFLAADGSAVAFTRRYGNEEIVCAFNLGSQPATITLGHGRTVHALTGHGFSGTLDGETIRLGSYQAWFGRMA